jgi:hypothetical protein
MLILLSPAKTLDFDPLSKNCGHSVPCMIKEANELAAIMKTIIPHGLSEMMGISPKLADLNYERYQLWTNKDTGKIHKQAIYAFKGDVYTGLDVETLSETDYLQSHVRILSGLYGYLRPLDLIQPYRLEMGTKLMNKRGKDLYAFWSDKVFDNLKNELKEHASPYVINLASNEYYKVVKKFLEPSDVITPVFKDFKNNQYKVISFLAKKARGMMTRFIAENKIEDPENIKLFDLGGYAYSETMSEQKEWVFIRG